MFPNFLTSNSLFHDDEEAKKEREQIYVPLALVERKKTEKRDKEYSPDRGSEIYEPQYEEKQRFEHDAFLKQVLQGGRGKTRGTRIALIGEPGAGKTTLLQKIADWVEEKKLGLPLWISLADLASGGSLQDFDSYLLERWLPKAVSEEGTQRDFQRQFEDGRVWLLLDGADEVAASGVETLGSIAKQLVGWVGKARVVLTCRLNVWQGDTNALSDFETFRLLDFDYPQQVHRFIDNWFAANTARGERLQAELAKAERSRIRDLVQTPLRLALLCRTWQFYEGDLPETRAGLYAQFVERFYHWKSNRFPIGKQRQRELNRGLGKLALADIDSGGGRFRLREGFVSEILGDGDDESSLFSVALKLGWLNDVGWAAESPEEKVYAFYHATFEEYFAALAVEDWHDFLNHVPENLASGTYRVFESQWKQVILLWLGRSDVDEVRKEEFIGELVDFDDETGRDFYRFRALFLAAAGIAEFKACSRGNEIVGQVVEVGFGFYSEEEQEWLTWPDEVEEVARVALEETESGRAVDALVELIGNTGSGEIRRQVGESLEKIAQGNDTAIAVLVELIGNSQSDLIRLQGAESLGKIDPGNDTAIAVLVELMGNSRLIRRQAAESLGKIDPGNDTAVAAVVELISNSQSNFIPRRRAAWSLGKIGKGNDTAITTLVELIGNSQYAPTRWEAAESLEKIGQGNDTAIAALIELIRNSQSDDIRRQATRSLWRIDPGNATVIAALVELIGNSQSDDTRRWAAWDLKDIAQGNNTAIAALVELIGNSQSDETRCQAAESLWKIDPGNDTAIAALLGLIGNSQSDETRCQAAESLGKIDPGNDTAIAALLGLIDNSQDEDIRLHAAWGLREIDPGNDKAIAALLELIGNSDDNGWLAAMSLEEITGEPQMLKVISALKSYLSDETYKNDRDLFDDCYKIIWNCAQTLPYPVFHQAWHPTETRKNDRRRLFPKNLARAIASWLRELGDG